MYRVHVDVQSYYYMYYNRFGRDPRAWDVKKKKKQNHYKKNNTISAVCWTRKVLLPATMIYVRPAFTRRRSTGSLFAPPRRTIIQPCARCINIIIIMIIIYASHSTVCVRIDLMKLKEHSIRDGQRTRVYLRSDTDRFCLSYFNYICIRG